MKIVEEQLLWLLQQVRPLVAARDSQALLLAALGQLLQLTRSARAYALVLTADGGLLHEQERTGDPIPEPADRRILQLAQACLKEGQPLLAHAEVGSPPPLARRALSELRLQFLVCLPLLVAQRPLGVLYADCRQPRPDLPGARTFALFADQVGLAWENARLFERAANDALTGLPNASSFLAQVGRQLQATPLLPVGVLLLDLDTFKRVNLAAGHEMGNRALIDVAHTLREVLSGDGLVARYGSDKFGVLLTAGSTTPVALRLRDVAERARATMATKNYYGVQLSACIGGAVQADAVDDAEALLGRAEAALATARARGPGQMAFS